MPLSSLSFNDGTVRIGYHTSIAGNTLSYTVLNSIGSPANCIQLYISSPRSYKPSRFSSEDIEMTRSLIDREKGTNFKVYVHACLLFNLNGSTHFDTIDENLKKTKTEKQKQKFIEERGRMHYSQSATIDGLRETLDIAWQAFGENGGVVVHVGSGENKQKAIERIAQNIEIVLCGRGSPRRGENGPLRGEEPLRGLLLENAAGEGNKIGSTLDDISQILNLLSPEVREHVNVCIDTCHLFAAGDYNISKLSEMKRFFNDFENKIGLEKLKVIHLNDSEKPFACKRDLHSMIGFGHIFSDAEGFSSLKYLLGVCKERQIDMILETYDPFFLPPVIDVIYDLSETI